MFRPILEALLGMNENMNLLQLWFEHRFTMGSWSWRQTIRKLNNEATDPIPSWSNWFLYSLWLCSFCVDIWTQILHTLTLYTMERASRRDADRVIACRFSLADIGRMPSGVSIPIESLLNESPVQLTLLQLFPGRWVKEMYILYSFYGLGVGEHLEFNVNLQERDFVVEIWWGINDCNSRTDFLGSKNEQS